MKSLTLYANQLFTKRLSNLSNSHSALALHCGELSSLQKNWKTSKLARTKIGGFSSTRWQQNLQVNIKGSQNGSKSQMSMQIWIQISRKTSIQHTDSQQGKHVKLLTKEVWKDCLLTLLIWLSKQLINSYRTLPSYLQRNRENLSKWHFLMLT